MADPGVRTSTPVEPPALEPAAVPALDVGGDEAAVETSSDTLTTVTQLSNETGRTSPPPVRLRVGPYPSHWRVPITGFLWRMFAFFDRQGHVRVTSEGLHHLRSFTPPIRSMFDLTTTAVCMVHTLASQRGVRGILEGWYERDRQVAAVTSPPPPLPATSTWAPWMTDRPWSEDTWLLSVLILSRFLAQPSGCREDDFLRSLHDLYATLGQEVAMIEYMVVILFFVKSSSWVWACLFNPSL